MPPPCVPKIPIEEIPYAPICAKPKTSQLIVIDPGHGGDDFGTHSTGKKQIHEKHLNLTTARFLKEYLDKMGFSTIMTRNEDVFIALDKRAEFANARRPSLFVSVHYNSAPSKEAEGVEVYYYREEDNKARTHASSKLGKFVLDKVLFTTEAKSRGVKHGNFAVIRETTMPAILVEAGFLTNDSEMQRIKSPAYMKLVALGIAQGIRDYLEKTQ